MCITPDVPTVRLTQISIISRCSRGMITSVALLNSRCIMLDVLLVSGRPSTSNLGCATVGLLGIRNVFTCNSLKPCEFSSLGTSINY